MLQLSTLNGENFDRWVCRSHPATLSRCGEILLSYAAILSLHILRFFPGLFALVEKAPQFQEIVHTKR